jgi:hypothetical protein
LISKSNCKITINQENILGIKPKTQNKNRAKYLVIDTLPC